MCPNTDCDSHKLSKSYLSVLFSFLIFLLFTSSSVSMDHSSDLSQVPLAFKGRFRPLGVYAQLQAEESPVLKEVDSPLEAILREHFAIPSDTEQLSTLISQLHEKKISLNDIAKLIEEKHPLSQRISQADTALKMLPGRYGEGVWLPLKALKLQVPDENHLGLIPVGNFTLYSDENFLQIQKNYLELDDAFQKNAREDILRFSHQLADSLLVGYREIAGESYLETHEKILRYPTLRQLQAETFYYSYPWTLFLIFSYAAVLLLITFAYWKPYLRNIGFAVWIGAFLLHSAVLALRCYILQRPPVSNMFETVIYVPWISVAAGLLFYAYFRNSMMAVASSLVTIILLTILEVTKMNHSLENVQAVLDSQYWLIIHVLLVVGSYGVFALSSVLAHFYLMTATYFSRRNRSLDLLSKSVLQTLYLGVAMLIAGTILGGVWAAESWGRFWDWDPKESWAFISICTYLVCIHAYRYHHIRDFGLAVGAVVGFLSISFTWYGVNYILGTGLHSYGFGSGGEWFYYGFCIAEVLFIVGMVTATKLSFATKFTEDTEKNHAHR